MKNIFDYESKEEFMKDAMDYYDKHEKELNLLNQTNKCEECNNCRYMIDNTDNELWTENFKYLIDKLNEKYNKEKGE